MSVFDPLLQAHRRIVGHMRPQMRVIEIGRKGKGAARGADLRPILQPTHNGQSVFDGVTGAVQVKHWRAGAVLACGGDEGSSSLTRIEPAIVAGIRNVEGRPIAAA